MNITKRTLLDMDSSTLLSLNIQSSSLLQHNSTVQEPQAFTGRVSLIVVGPVLQLVGSVLLLSLVPTSLTTSEARRQKWRSTQLARLSAAISGLWALAAFYDSLPLRRDLMYGSSDMAVNLIIFSLGVHIAEVVDMIVTRQFSLLSVHHLAVIICFAGALLAKCSVGFAVLTLITELNAVTNKTRILHIIGQKDTGSLQFIINSYVNIFTFFIRILIIFWMNNQAFQYFSQDPCLFFACCSLGLLFVNMWNLLVFKTLVVKDIFRKKKKD